MRKLVPSDHDTFDLESPAKMNLFWDNCGTIQGLEFYRDYPHTYRFFYWKVISTITIEELILRSSIWWFCFPSDVLTSNFGAFGQDVDAILCRLLETLTPAVFYMHQRTIRLMTGNHPLANQIVRQYEYIYGYPHHP